MNILEEAHTPSRKILVIFGVILVATTLPGIAAPATEAPQRVEIRAVLDGDAEPRSAVLIFQSVLGDTAGEEEIPIQLPGVLRVPVPAAGDAFRLHLVSAMYWAADQILPRGALEEPVEVLLRRRGALTGLFTPTGDEPLPEHVVVRFQPTVTPACASCAAPEDVRGEVRCPLNGGEWQCSLPEGALDLRLEVPGFIPHYLFDRVIDPGEALVLGSLPLAVGASVVGRVEDLTGQGAPGVTVTVDPERGGGPARPNAPRLDLAIQRVTTDARGFFQVAGLPPGSYRLQGERLQGKQGILRSASTVLTVQERQEAELTAPLVLAPPLDFAIQVAPPQDPHEAPWSVLLIAQPSGATATGSVDAEGSWTARGLEGGEYLLLVQDSQGARFHSEAVEIDGQALGVVIDLEVVPVEGEVTLGEDPLSAQLFFGGRSGRTSIPLTTDEAGRFAGLLPRSGDWAVDVVSVDPPIQRRLAAVPVPEPQGDAPARIQIALPDTRLDGTVVDETGSPVRGAMVLIAPMDQKEQLSPVRTGADGGFHLQGFAPGRFRLEAHDLGTTPKRSSAPQEVEILEDLDPPPLRLVLNAGLRLEGKVHAATGAGIAGAEILAQPLQGSGFGATLMARALSDPGGGFTLDLPHGTDALEVTVLAPGFLFHRARIPIPPGQTGRVLGIPLVQEGAGEIHLVGFDPARRGQLYFQRDGLPWDLPTLLRWARLHGVAASETVVRIPQMPPGEYALCTLDGETCEAQILPAHGTIQFQGEPEP
jgi:hypothetical protein